MDATTHRRAATSRPPLLAGDYCGTEDFARNGKTGRRRQRGVMAPSTVSHQRSLRFVERLDVRRQHLFGVKRDAAFTQSALESEEVRTRHLGRRDLADASARIQRASKLQAHLFRRQPLVRGDIRQFNRHDALLAFF
jgi:hypothetical protein